VEHVESNHPDLLSFADELIHLDQASRVNVETIQKVLKQMDSSIKNLDMDLDNVARVPSGPDDRFAEAMGEFCEKARGECDILQAMAAKMDQLFTTLSEYFVFDKQKYTMEEFMGDIKAFKDQFQVNKALYCIT